MILMVSGRTDIVAFYSEWFMNRYNDGYVDVRNPFNPKLVSRINFSDVDAIMFCTKNPLPILKYIDKIRKPILFHVTLTPYKNDIEPNVIPKGLIIEGIKKISKIIGKENVVVRYDPIIINERYTIEYHKKAFLSMCNLLNGYVEKIIVSFVDEYKNVRANMSELRYRDLSDDDYRQIGLSFSSSAKKNNMTVQTCFEERNLSEYGFIVDDCISKQVAYMLTGKKYKKWTARKGNKCNCVQVVDIGEYNSCMHMCKYCYANYDSKRVSSNIKKHDKNSSLLLGNINSDDIIKERKK